MADKIIAEAKNIEEKDLEKVTGGSVNFVVGKKVFHYCPYCCEDHYVLTKSSIYVYEGGFDGFEMRCPIIQKNFQILIEDDEYTYRNNCGLPISDLETKKHNPTMYGDF